MPRLLGAQSLLLQSDGPSRDDHLLLSLAGVRLVVVVVHVGIVSESAWYMKMKTWRVFFFARHKAKMLPHSSCGFEREPSKNAHAGHIAC